MNDPKLKLMELDVKHNELLSRLEDLDREISQVLTEWACIEPRIVSEQWKEKSENDISLNI